MEISEIRNALEAMNEQIISYRRSLDLDRLEEDIAAYEQEMSEPSFWDDSEKANQVIQKNNELKSIYDTFHKMELAHEETSLLFEMYKEEPDEEVHAEIVEAIQSLEKDLQQYELSMLLNGPHDKNSAILEIHPGAGGTESQDWGSMLLRMYMRWAEKHGYRVETVDYQDGDEAGIKSVTLSIEGLNAYGYLRSEKGVHRLVRISPFDAAGKRHTSFCSVDVVPQMDGDIDIEINPDDLKVDVYRASGAGGQHINKTSSAVRITHIPTGIVTQSQAQRSQFKNRDQAMAMLKAKLFQLEEEKKAAELAAIRGEQKDIAWGSQIRNYVFHPYSMVKDLRSGYETGNIGAVMDGDLDPFMDAYLKWTLEGTKAGEEA
ncbi:peptide chain release factor 2 [Granulicatella adiacens]|uniref:peptide chain release factor 2 n=1 Tax=Granulicatella adiacens TaxID=46124 RepID=UPI0021D98880|nr:peptide chain release factor 2 [Granulicatella adiacens]UXY42007.1 peptide chain release factor 2 [Granulicatella adiacens]